MSARRIFQFPERPRAELGQILEGPLAGWGAVSLLRLLRGQPSGLVSGVRAELGQEALRVAVHGMLRTNQLCGSCRRRKGLPVALRHPV